MPSSTTSSTPTALTAAAPTGRPLLRLALSLLLIAALPLLWQLTPVYDISGVLVAPLAFALALALAATARIGWRALPALAAGAAIGAAGWPLAAPGPVGVTEALTLLAQAAFGGLLLRRSGRPDDLALDTDPAIRRLVAAALACALMGGFARLMLDLTWSDSPAQRPLFAALVRATADGASVLLLTPVLLAFIAPQHQRWAARRRTVALPLALLALLLLGAFAGIEGRERQHAQQRFERDADVVFARTQALLDAPAQAVQAVNGAMRNATPALSAPAFDALARPWLARTAGVAHLGWLDTPRGDGSGPSAVRHLISRGATGGGPPSNDAEALPAALLSREGAARTLTAESVQVSPVVSLGTDRPGFVLYQALPLEPGASGRAVVFATVLADPLMTQLLAARSDALRVCLYDQDPRAERRRLYGGNGCETASAGDSAGFMREASFDFAGRRWSMRISQPLRTPGGVWLFALPALAGCGLFALLLLKVTGRVERIEADARSRTGELRREIDLLRQAQHRGEQALDGAFEAAQTGLALLESDGRVQRANAAFAEVLGMPVADLKRRPIDELLGDEAHPHDAGLAMMLREAGDELMHRTLRLKLPSGRVLPALVTLRVLRDADGRAAAAVCALHDLSDQLRRRHAERVLGEVMDLSGSNPPTLPPPLRNASHGARPASAQRILCVHRDAAHAAVLRQALADRPLAQLSLADGLGLGLSKAFAEAPHLIVLDAELADGDGLQLLRQLQADPRTRAIPVIVLSDDPRPARIDAAFSEGARAYLTRPVEPAKLLAAIDELI
ncbi:response regulator [Aquincola sp. S2]|uniref:Response regulator n=1 Tax=Pseudaquabacterium terrae TaxID=2732868 RepID=A0ABX2EH44_9BURK|nr:response regulator [Aquabacterium terrae]NRF67947.1 response regulator [Aquabacterium terrae]